MERNRRGCICGTLCVSATRLFIAKHCYRVSHYQKIVAKTQPFTSHFSKVMMQIQSTAHFGEVTGVGSL